MNLHPKYTSYVNKHNRAVSKLPIKVSKTEWRYCPKKRSFESETLFTYNNMEYRFDYEWFFDEKLPRVNDIRELLWESMVDYRMGTQ